MGDKTHKVCRSCFFSEKFPGVGIGKNGRCNFCNSNDFEAQIKAQTTLGIAELRKEILEAKTGKYDCIIAASGGIDSSYVIYIAKKMLNLNPLVINYDSGFNYNIARENLENICSRLKMDLKVVKSTKKYDIKFIKYWITALRDVDLYWGICRFCNYMLLAVIFKYALQGYSSIILSSSNLYEGYLYEKRLLNKRFIAKEMLKNIFKLNIIKLARFIFYVIIAQYYLMRLKLEFCVPPLVYNIFRRYPKKPNRLKIINVTKYVSWDINNIVKTMEDEMGWKYPEKPGLPMRLDCKIESGFLNYTYKRATGITTHGIICNNLIYGRIGTKDELEDTVKYYDANLIQVKEQMLKDLKMGR